MYFFTLYTVITGQKLRGIFEGEYKTTGKGIGLKNIDMRIKYYFGKQYGIFTGRKNNMSVVGFTIPLYDESYCYNADE